VDEGMVNTVIDWLIWKFYQRWRHNNRLVSRKSFIMIRFIVLTVVLMATACSEDDPINENCPDRIIVSESKYQSVNNDNAVLIQEMSIEDDCLLMKVGFSGCDDEHTILMVTDGSVAESFPVQVYFKLSDENPQACQAFFVKDLAFDLDQLNVVVGDEPRARLVFPQQEQEILWDR
jgi:hypothetical protein